MLFFWEMRGTIKFSMKFFMRDIDIQNCFEPWLFSTLTLQVIFIEKFPVWTVSEHVKQYYCLQWEYGKKTYEMSSLFCKRNGYENAAQFVTARMKVVTHSRQLTGLHTFLFASRIDAGIFKSNIFTKKFTNASRTLKLDNFSGSFYFYIVRDRTRRK